MARLDRVSTAKTVRLRRGAHATADGPYIETKEWLVGFYLIDCASEDEAMERARMICPIERSRDRGASGRVEMAAVSDPIADALRSCLSERAREDDGVHA